MLLVVNPAAAGGRLGRAWPDIARRLAGVGLTAPVAVTRAPGHASEIAAAAAADGHRTVVAVGGDGTICEVVQGIRDAGRGEVGILPLGTGNDAARTLGIPLDLEAAAAALLAGERREVDLIRVGDRVVLNAVGIGLLGAINVNAAAIKVVRGISAYLAAAAVSLFRYRAPHVTVRTGDFEFQGAMVILAVHNGPTTGGGFRLTPGALASDGRLDACLVEDIPPLRRMGRLVSALKGSLGGRPGSHPFTFTRLELGCAAPLPCHLDGNPFHIEPPGTVIEVMPRALVVIVPATSRPAPAPARDE